MSRSQLQRIAFVKLSPKGKSYAMRCDRKDLVEGNNVEVLMYASTKKEYYDDGYITSISHERWSCSCHVVNLICEVSYKFHNNGFTRIIKKSPKTRIKITSWRAHKAPYIESLGHCVVNDMQELYDSIAPESGEDAYLGDGIWVKAYGSTEDRGK